MKYEAKSVIFGRRPRQNPEEFKTAFFSIYAVTEPLKTQEFPKHDLTFPNTEKVVIKSPNAEYFLEGNDIIFDNISSVDIVEENSVITVIVE